MNQSTQMFGSDFFGLGSVPFLKRRDGSVDADVPKGQDKATMSMVRAAIVCATIGTLFGEALKSRSASGMQQARRLTMQSRVPRSLRKSYL